MFCASYQETTALILMNAASSIHDSKYQINAMSSSTYLHTYFMFGNWATFFKLHFKVPKNAHKAVIFRKL